MKKNNIYYLTLPLLFFPILLRFYGKKSSKCYEDQLNTLMYRANPFKNELMQFVFYFLKLPEYRSVYYMRCGFIGKLFNLFLRGRNTLYIRMKSDFVGGGIVLNHAHSTEINASSIGSNCVIFQNVTIGTNGTSIGPHIGNNCFFGAGSVILGHIKIGNNVRVGANAIVVKDVPDNCTVVSKSSVIVKQNNKRVNIPL